jgi:hypothetical protein
MTLSLSIILMPTSSSRRDQRRCRVIRRRALRPSDRHLQSIAEHGRIGWQKQSGYTRRALVESAIRRFKRVIGDALRSRTEPRRRTEIDVAIHALNRMLEIGRPKSVRIA